MESAAIQLLTRSIELDQQSRLQPALMLFEEGICMLLDVCKKCDDPKRREHYRKSLDTYMTRAEKIKLKVSELKSAGKYREEIKIKEDSCGYCYESIFKWYLDETVTRVSVEDAYIRNFHQINNFLRFCELLVLKCKNLRTISLITSKDKDYGQQVSSLGKIRDSVATKSIVLQFDFSESLHDRKIELSNGWVIKIGRGLDYFKRAEKLTLGFHEMNLRKCMETTVDIFHNQH